AQPRIVGNGRNAAGEYALMKHIPEGVIQVPNHPTPQRRCRGGVPFLMMTCAPGVPVCFTVPENSVCAD
ncbi:hypothetical protein, partial [Escherichia coli]|uniref:hypothetical protein n=1 Tax=Escherichia coli TaxID=562 RepID=UPI001BB04257